MSTQDCKSWRRAQGRECSTCPRIFNWGWKPAGWDKDGFEETLRNNEAKFDEHILNVEIWEKKNELGKRMVDPETLGVKKQKIVVDKA